MAYSYEYYANKYLKKDEEEKPSYDYYANKYLSKEEEPVTTQPTKPTLGEAAKAAISKTAQELPLSVLGGITAGSQTIKAITDPVGAVMSDLGIRQKTIDPLTGEFTEQPTMAEKFTQEYETLGLPKAWEQVRADTQEQQDILSRTTGLTRKIADVAGQLPQVPLYFNPLGLPALGLAATGQKRQELYESEAPVGKQLTGAGLSGIAETGTEMLTFGVIDDMLKATSGAQIAKNAVKEVFTEFFGESITQGVDPYINLYSMSDYELPTFTQQSKNILDAGITGALGAVILGGVSSGITTSKFAIENRNNKKEMQKILDDIVVDMQEKGTYNEDVVAEAQAQIDKMPSVEPSQADTATLTEDAATTLGEEAQAVTETPIEITQESITQELDAIEQGLNENNADESIKKLQEVKGKLPMNLQMFAEQIDNLIERATKLSKTFESVQKSPMVSDEIKKQLKSTDFEYEQITNKETLEKARANPKTKEEFLAMDNFVDNEVDVARGIELMRKASNEGDFTTFNQIALKQAVLLRKSGRELQAVSMLRKMTPEGYLQYALKEIDKLNKTPKQRKALEAINKIEQLSENLSDKSIEEIMRILEEQNIETKEEITKDTIQEYIDEIERKAKAIKLTESESKAIYDKIVEAQKLTGRARDVAYAEAYKMIEEKMPTRTEDVISMLQRIALLLNPKTQIRNFGGNIIMQTLEIAKESVGIPLDIALSKVTGKRSVGGYNFEALKKGLEGYKKGLYEAWDDYKRDINTRRDMGQIEVVGTHRSLPENTRFKPINIAFKGLNEIDRLVKFMLSAGDRPFFEATYAFEKSRLEELGELTSNQIHEQAIEVAEERTFTNKSKLAETATDVRKKTGLFGRIVLPFAYTPSNIIDKAFDYTPLGGIRVIKTNLIDDIKKGQFNQRQFVDRLSRNLTGTALMYLGFELAKAGLLTGAYPDDKDERAFMQSLGAQDYAFVVGDTQIPYDWAQPTATPIAAGANLYEQLGTSTNAKQTIWNNVAQASLESSKTILEQPLFSNLQQLFGGYGEETMIENVAQTAIEAPMQLVPLISLARTVRKVSDPKIRNIDYNSLIDQLRNSFPVLSEGLPTKYSTLGEESEYTGGAIQKILSPADVATVEISPLEQVILDVYADTGNNDVFPKVAPKRFSYDGTSYALTKQEQSEFQDIMGDRFAGYLELQLDNPSFMNLDSAIKLEVIKGFIDDAYDYAKTEYLISNGIE